MKLYYLPGACPLAGHIVLEWIGAPYETVRMSHLMRFARRMEADPGVQAAILAEESVLA